MVESFRTSDITGIDLYPFQIEDVESLQDRRSVLLAWEMGTGKTYAAIEIDLRRRELFASEFPDKRIPPTLVIAPLTTLRSTWETHFHELAPQLSVRVIDPKRRESFLQTLEAGHHAQHDVYIVHWEALRLLIKDQRFNRHWLHVIADEAHRAKNRKAQQTRALKRIRTAFKTALTGTPVTNKPYDFWSVLNWLYPDQWRSYWRFYESYCDYEIQYPHGYHKFLGPKNEDDLLDNIRPYYRRHLKRKKCCPHHPEGVQPQLPEKYYTPIWVDLDPKQRRAYDQMKKDMIAWLENQSETQPLVAPVAIAQLVRLQQLSAAYATIASESTDTGSAVQLTEPSSKLDALMEIIEDNEGEQIVVFSSFKQLIKLACERLDRAGISYVTITGDVRPDDRHANVAAFQSGEAQILLGTIAAGGEGITLTAASVVVFLDRDWSPAKNAQAEDRLHRIGQRDSVQVIDIIARNTVDLGRHQKLELKKEWIRRILGDTT